MELKSLSGPMASSGLTSAMRTGGSLPAASLLEGLAPARPPNMRPPRTSPASWPAKTSTNSRVRPRSRCRQKSKPRHCLERPQPAQAQAHPRPLLTSAWWGDSPLFRASFESRLRLPFRRRIHLAPSVVSSFTSGETTRLRAAVLATRVLRHNAIRDVLFASANQMACASRLNSRNWGSVASRSPDLAASSRPRPKLAR